MSLFLRLSILPLDIKEGLILHHTLLGEGRRMREAPPCDLISCLQPVRMVIPSPIVQHFLILLAPSDSPNMKS